MTKTKFYLPFFFVTAIFVLPPLFAPFFPPKETAMEFTGFSWWNAACLLLAALLNSFLGEFPGEAFRGFFFKANGNCNVDENCGANENAVASGSGEANGTVGHGNPRGFSTEKNDSFESESFCTRLFDFLYRGILFVFTPGAGKFRRVIVLAEFLKTFGILFAVQAFFAFLGFALKLSPRTAVYFPAGVAGFFSCAAVFFAAAFYEETLYRAYLPFSLKKLFCKESRPHSQTERSRADDEAAAEADSAHGGKRERFSDAAVELAAIAIFGFSHFNNGALSAANALVAGFFLRRCAMRTGGIKAGLFAHFLYNALTLAMFYTTAYALR